MSSDFDPLKAAREEIGGLAEVLRVLKHRERDCEEAMGRAESELNAVRKLRGFCDIQIAQLREEIAKLEAATT